MTSGPPTGLRWLIRLLPAGFRARHQDELARSVVDQLDGLGPLARSWRLTRIAVDMARVGVLVRLSALRLPPARLFMRGFLQDLSSAWRALVRRPGAAVVPGLTLAIGIGATATVFSVVHHVLLRPLPYAAANRIGILWHEFGQGAQNLPALHPLDVYDYREWSGIFERVTLATGGLWALGGGESPELVDVGLVEAGFFEFFGATPAIGRAFAPEEDRPGGPPVVILSDRIWQRRYGADPDVIGRLVDLEGRARRVVGVLPASFRLHLPEEAFRLRDAAVWVPAAVDVRHLPPRNFTGFTGFVRLRPGATFAEGQHELDAMAARLRERHPEHQNSDLRARVEPLHRDVVKHARDRLVLLQIAVGLVLLIACANVANLLLVRGRARMAELSLRSALGAGRRRLVQLVLIESGLLAAAGGATGVFLAVGAVRAIASLGRRVVPLVDGVSIDLTVVAFAAAVSLACALAFGVLPASQAAGGSPARLLGQAGRTTGSRRQARLRDVLVTIEVALCLVLLVGTGLMIRSFGRLSVVDPGYATNGVTTFTISLPGQAFADPERRRDAYDEIAQRLENLPGVVHVARISQLPLSGSGPLQPYAWDAETADNWESVTADERMVTSGFFEAIGATFVAGRDFTEDEVRSGARVIIVDDRLAARAFPEGAVGRRLQVESNGTPEQERFAEIVGVVRHLRLHDLARPHLTQIYFPARPSGWQSYVVRSAPGAGPLAAAIERQVAAVVPTAPVDGLATMSSLAREALAPARFALVLMLAFGAVAVLLAGVGIYGVLAFAVTQRTREIGLRMALGQAPADARRQVLLHGARLVGVALALGLVAAVAAGQGVSHLLFGVSPLDPATYAAACVSLAGLAMLACWVPARRATRVDPVQALRAQ